MLTLLRLHLHTADASSVADGTFALSEPEWGAVYALACRQGVQAVTYDAVKTLPKGLLPPKAHWSYSVDIQTIQMNPK